MRRLKFLLAVPIVAFATACAGSAGPTSPPTSPPVANPTPPPTPVPAPLMAEGVLAPGTYRLPYEIDCTDRKIACPDGAILPPPIDIEFTVPAGWEGAPELTLVAPRSGREPRAPNNSSVVLGWTGAWTGLYSEPCMDQYHAPDIPVGPTVDEFVEAVIANPKFDVTEAGAVELGDHSGQLFTLTGPADVSDCSEWSPWEDGFWMQGPNNIWDVWAMDVDGFLLLITNEYFPETPHDVKAELRAIAESVRFVR